MEAIGNSSCVAMFDRHEDAEAAIRALQKDGFDMKKLSIIGRDYHTEEHAVGFYNVGARVKYWGKLGAFWGTIFGVLFAPAVFWIPGIGPILTGGIMGSILMGTIEGAAAGAAVGSGSGVLVAALTSIGIPKDSVIHYEANLRANKFLLIAHGNAAEAQQARDILGTTRAIEVQIHSR